MILLAATAFDVTVSDLNYYDTEALFDWIRSVGVFVDPHHTICKEVPGDPTSVHGIFSNLDIASGDLLVDIFWKDTLIYADG